LIRESDAERAVKWVHEAVATGARLIIGGGRKGSIVEPTILTNTRAQMKVNAKKYLRR